LYADPQYGKQDRVEACKWFFLAATRGAKIEKYKDYWEKQITPEQIDLATRKALEFLTAGDPTQKETIFMQKSSDDSFSNQPVSHPSHVSDPNR
jgi:hypothetical protein